MTPDLTFVTGKGGVGKTRMSLLLAQEMKGARLAELTPALKSEAERLKLSCPPILHIDRQGLAQNFLERSFKVKTLMHFISESKTFQTLLGLAPNLYEILQLRQWIEWTHTQPLIVDAPATGHFIGLFDATKTTIELFDGGSLRKIAEEIFEFLQKRRIRIVIVSLPERSALAEAESLSEYFSVHFPNFKIQYILNRRHLAPGIGTPSLREPFQALAYERPRREEARILDFEKRCHPFNQIVMEGSRHL